MKLRNPAPLRTTVRNEHNHPNILITPDPDENNLIATSGPTPPLADIMCNNIPLCLDSPQTVDFITREKQQTIALFILENAGGPGLENLGIRVHLHRSCMGFCVGLFFKCVCLRTSLAVLPQCWSRRAEAGYFSCLDAAEIRNLWICTLAGCGNPERFLTFHKLTLYIKFSLVVSSLSSLGPAKLLIRRLRKM